MKHIFTVVCAVFLFCGPGFGQKVHISGYFRNSVYAYSTQKSIGSDETELHTQLYQTLRTDLQFKQFGNWQFHLAGRALTDFGESDLSELKRFKAYRLSVSATNLFGFVDLEIGRQFLHPGTVLGSLDGINVQLNPWAWFSWQVYGGVETHLFRAAKVYAWDEAAVLGSQFKFKGLFRNNLNLIYLQKNAHGQLQWQLAGVNLNNYSIKNLVILLQAHYDLLNKRFHRLYLSTRYQLGSRWLLNVYVKQQYPQIYNTSYFQIFEVQRYLLSGVNVVYQLNNGLALSGMMQGVQLKEGFGNRFIVMLSSQKGNVGLVYETGDLGNQFGALLDYRYALLKNLQLTLNVDYTRYRFEKRFEYDHQLANALGVCYRFSKHWSTRVEYQWLQNAQYQSDQRILNHINFVW